MAREVRITDHIHEWPGTAGHRHYVQFYESDEFLLKTLADFVSGSLFRGEASIVVATEQHLDGLNSRLSEVGIDLSMSQKTGQFAPLEASQTMALFMEDGSPDPDRFHDVFSSIISRASAAWPIVRVYGEMVALTAEVDNQIGTLQIEELWNDLQRSHHFTLCCAYPIDSFASPGSEGLLRDICAAHQTVLPTESYTSLTTLDERQREVALLQQKANRLELEVARRERVEEQLRIALESERAARREAEEALRARDEFVSIAAHELKTPLTSLVGHAQLMSRHLRDSEVPDRDRLAFSVNSVSRQADKLSRLITQLLDISRFEAGKLPIETQKVDLSALIHDVVAGVHSSHESHSILISAPETLVADIDALRFEQVLSNLLNNAVRYSPDGGTITISLCSPEPDVVELSIRDYGLGIPPDKRDRIFERFYQAHQHESRSGMGLGLYISRRIVRMHGGELFAKFPEDGGTCFVIRLPAHSPA